MSLVKTFDGTKANREDCRKIKGDFYEMGKQCFLMPDNKWHRINNNKITKDYDSEKYVFISDDLINGVVGKDKDGSLKTGFFKPDRARNVRLNTGNSIISCLDRKILENGEVEECIGSGEFHTETSNTEYLEKKTIRRGYASRRLDYRCDSKMDVTTVAFEKYFSPKQLKHGFHKLLPPVTFGVEFETQNGRLPEDLLMQNGLIPVRDGSLRNNEGTQPYEYASIVLQGKTGLQAISNQCDLLNKYCTQSYENSLHVHIGSIPLSKEFIVSMYNTAKAVQEEMYEMFPKAMRNTGTFKRQDYCAPLKGFRFKKGEVDYNFDKIYKHLAMNSELEFKKFGDEHPSDPGNTSKWNIHSRYKIVNMVTTIFGKNGTVEYRIHPSSFNKDKIVNWVYIVAAISWYAYTHKNDETIKGLSLDTILDEVYPSNIVSDYLKEYIAYRKLLMRDDESRGDVTGQRDVSEDSTKGLNTKIKSLIEHE